ncbi:MAG: glycosyltransferase family 39 protein [Planctomycetaceae bacterium]|nr:glycosyltransferase family 39 protein [Planctomycetaceae bacterium]
MSSPRHTIAFFLGILCLATVLRILWPGHMQIEHFDEGVYASGFFAGHLDNRFPDQQLYAPPLFPAMAEWALILCSSAVQAPLWLSVLLGIALVVASYWAAREWFDESTALAAAMLVATSDFTILFSRAALTDTPLCLWLTLGLVAGSRGLRTGGVLWIILGALFAALGWWTKYNGWLCPAILGAGLLGWTLWERPPLAICRSAWLRWLLFTALTFALWLPLLWILAPYGGYAAVAANHRGYFGGFPLWPEAFVRQFLVQQHLTGYASGVGIYALWIWLWFMQSRQQFSLGMEASAPLVAISLPLLIVGTGIWALIPVGLIALWFDRRRQPGTPEDQSPLRVLPYWILLAWLASLMLAVPLYRPYPRLQLPLIVAICIAGARGLVLMVRHLRSSASHAHLITRYGVPALLLALSLGSIVLRGGPPSTVAWESRAGLHQIALQTQQDLPHWLKDRPASQVLPLECLVYVLAEPGLFYQLAALEQHGTASYVTQPASNLGMLEPGKSDHRLPNLLLTGPHAHRDHPELLSSPPPQLILLKEVPYHESQLVLLDDMSPAEAARTPPSVVRIWAIDSGR